ncbi:ParB/RepB/Spo0J family partition protein [Roseospira marina]|uniref:ParB/RepB/Spo0J family partition protein n=2 Tax=Roseospira marina TaxID=140057 RepID=A0A5M6I7Z5_9PROT|nr:ParB/RepB/Spo0J family partition protein [Roseospira marina]
MIPVDAIHVLNPRARNKRQHREIVDNIAAVGLKRPITVSRRRSGNKTRYDLVCGEGRLEAFRMLGEDVIPALVIEAPQEACLIMSLVENIARRPHRPIDLMVDIGTLAKRGYTDAQIAEKIGCSRSWVFNVLTLLERGEERLVSAVETGLIPIGLAVEIAMMENEDAQTVLMEAYETGKIKGKKIAAIRRLLDLRDRQRRGLKNLKLGRKASSRRLTAEDLLRVYQREAEKHRLLAKKADYTQARLLFIVEAMKDLHLDEGYTTLLRAEGLDSMPRPLAERMDGRARG